MMETPQPLIADTSSHISVLQSILNASIRGNKIIIRLLDILTCIFASITTCISNNLCSIYKKNSFHSPLHFWQLLSVLSDNQVVTSQTQRAVTKTLCHTAPAEPANTLYGAYGNSCILPNSSDCTIVRLLTAENTLLL